MAATGYTSGMQQSFDKVVPGAKPVSSGSNQVAQPSTSKPASNFSQPVSAVPTPAKPVSTTAGPMASPATTKPAGPAPVGTKPPTASSPFKMNIDMSQIGKLVGTGVNLGQAVQGAIPTDFLSQMKWYLGNPGNFANAVGALSPITQPLMRTAGLPLMMGAYSMLRDPNYARDLTNGYNVKMSAAAAPVTAKPAPTPSQSFNFDPPTGLGSMQPTGPSLQPNDAIRPPIKLRSTVLQQTQPPGVASNESKARLGLNAAGLGAGLATAKIPGFAGKALGGPVLTTALDAANIAGLPEAFDGKKAPSWEEIARRHESALNPSDWAQGYGQILNNPESGPVGKTVQTLAHTAFANPVSQMVFAPVSTAATAAQNVREGLGAIDQLQNYQPNFMKKRLAEQQRIANLLKQLPSSQAK